MSTTDTHPQGSAHYSQEEHVAGLALDILVNARQESLDELSRILTPSVLREAMIAALDELLSLAHRPAAQVSTLPEDPVERARLLDIAQDYYLSSDDPKAARRLWLEAGDDLAEGLIDELVDNGGLPCSVSRVRVWRSPGRPHTRVTGTGLTHLPF